MLAVDAASVTATQIELVAAFRAPVRDAAAVEADLASPSRNGRALLLAWRSVPPWISPPAAPTMSSLSGASNPCRDKVGTCDWWCWGVVNWPWLAWKCGRRVRVRSRRGRILAADSKQEET